MPQFTSRGCSAPFAVSAVEHQAVQRAEQAPQPLGDVREAGEAMGHRLARVPARLLLVGDRLPARVDELHVAARAGKPAAAPPPTAARARACVPPARPACRATRDASLSA